MWISPAKLFIVVITCVVLPVALVVGTGCQAQEGSLNGDDSEASRANEIQNHRFPNANVVLISIDTLRADRLSLYGYHRPTSPELEKLAADAVVFDSFHYSGGGTLPSHLSMLTSLHPRTHFIHPGNQRRLESQWETLAEHLKDVGYATAAFTDGGWMSAKFGFDQGFDVFDEAGGRFQTILPKAYGWLETMASQPFFLFIHTYDVHSEHKTSLPYSCPGELEKTFAQHINAEFDGCRGDECATRLLASINKRIETRNESLEDLLSPIELQFISALYDGCISYADSKIAEVISKLKQLGVYESTLLIVTSDHGEEFAEHGRMLHEQGGYEELSHLPLILKFPESQFAGLRVPALATIVDVMPTVLDVLALTPSTQAQGFTLIPAVTMGQHVRKDLHMYSVLRTERWKYLSDKRELYDLQNDQAEAQNVYDQYPQVVQELEERVRSLAGVDIKAHDEFMSSLAVTSNDQTGNVDLTDEEIQKLKALGYLN